MLYKIKKFVYYDPFSKEYQKILTINKLPPSSSNIYKNIKTLKNNKLIPYDRIQMNIVYMLFVIHMNY